MDIFAFGPIATMLDAAYTVVTFLTQSLHPLFGIGAAAAAIALLTMLVRTALIPVGISQVRAELTRKRLAPKIDELRRRYGKDREKLQRKTMELYAQEKASPLAGCLPMLAQAPVLSLVYALFLHQRIGDHANALLAHHLFGVPLGTSFLGTLGAGGAIWPGILVFCALLAILAVVAQLSRKLLGAAAGQAGAPGMPGMAGILSLTPFITVVFAAFVPLAAGIYLVVTTSWTLVERTALRRRFGVNALPGTS